MTVRELIAALEKMPPDLDVWYDWDNMPASGWTSAGVETLCRRGDDVRYPAPYLPSYYQPFTVVFLR